MSSIEIMVELIFFHQNSMSKAIIHGNQGFAHKDFGVSCPFSISDVGVRSSSNVGNFFQAQYRSRALESSKVVLINPPKCGASTFTTLDHQVLNHNHFKPADLRDRSAWVSSIADEQTKASHNKCQKKIHRDTKKLNSNKRSVHCSVQLNLTSEAIRNLKETSCFSGTFCPKVPNGQKKSVATDFK